MGWKNVVTGFKNKTCAKAENFAIVFQIDQEDFMNLIKRDHKDFTKISQIKEKMLQKPFSFKKGCLVCQKLTHNVVKCPKIHFIPNSIQNLIEFFKKASEKAVNKRK